MVEVLGIGRLNGFLRTLLEQVQSEMACSSPERAHSLLYPHYDSRDLQLAAVFCMFLLLIRFLLGGFIIPLYLPIYSLKVQVKLTENIFYTAYYASASVLCLFLVRKEKWIWDFASLGNDKRCFYAMFNEMPPPKSDIVHLYYVLTLGFYTSAVLFLFAFDTLRSDFNEFLLHHFVTLGLVLTSYRFGFVRGGVAVMALHDIGDLFLYLAKTLHYLGFVGLDTGMFAVFAITFYITRLVLLPRISYAITVETMLEMASNPAYNNWARNFDTSVALWFVFSVLTSTLILLHCFWFTLILKMIYREVFLGKKISQEGDIREG